eukprot:SAG31_NODE_5042_length_2781_cov_1.423192_3_plen_206_part_00
MAAPPRLTETTRSMWHHVPSKHVATVSITESQLHTWASMLVGQSTMSTSTSSGSDASGTTIPRVLDMRNGVLASRLLIAVFPCLQQSVERHVVVEPCYGKQIAHNWQVLQSLLTQLEIPTEACDVSGIRSSRTSAIAVYEAALYCMSHCNEVSANMGFASMFAFALPLAVIYWLQTGYLRTAERGGCAKFDQTFSAITNDQVRKV